MNPDPLVVIAIAIPLTFAAIFSIVGQVSGWSALARVYRHRGTFRGPRWRFQDLALRSFMNYSGCVTVGIDEEGLYLAFPPRIGHPPLLLPWNDLALACKEENVLGWRDYWIEFTCAQVPAVRFRLRDKLMQRIRPYMGPVSAAADPAPVSSSDVR
jgi:hypothetical protein